MALTAVGKKLLFSLFVLVDGPVPSAQRQWLKQEMSRME